MKILFFAPAHKIHVWRWARWMVDHGVTVGMISDGPAPRDRDYSGVQVMLPRWPTWEKIKVFKLQGGPYANNANKGRIYRPLVEAFAPDIIHAHEALVYGPALADYPDCPRVLTPWGPDIEALANPATPAQAARLTRLACASADVITTNGPGLESHWAALTRQSAEKFRLFSWGVDEQFFTPASLEAQKALRKELLLNPGVPIILSPRLAKALYKIDVLLDGWRIVQEETKAKHRHELVVLRAGADEESWTALQRQAAGLPRLRLLDRFLPPEQMAVLYSTAAWTVMLPETDLLASSVLEAAGCGSALLLRRLPCYEAALGSGEEAESPNRGVALWMPPKPDAADIARGLESAMTTAEEERAAVATHNRRWIERCERWDVRAAEMLDVYRSLL